MKEKKKQLNEDEIKFFFECISKKSPELLFLLKNAKFNAITKEDFIQEVMKQDYSENEAEIIHEEYMKVNDARTLIGLKLYLNYYEMKKILDEVTAYLIKKREQEKENFNVSMKGYLDDLWQNDKNYWDGLQFWFVDENGNPRMIRYDKSNERHRRIVLEGKTFRTYEEVVEYIKNEKEE